MKGEREPEAPEDDLPAEGDLPDEGDLPEEGDLPPEGDLPDAPDSADADPGALDDVDLRDALRGALRPPPGSVAPELLTGVQRRLRVRSRGKFYGDGWSTAQSPRSTYLVTSALMLALVLIVLFVLVPWTSAKL